MVTVTHSQLKDEVRVLMGYSSEHEDSSISNLNVATVDTYIDALLPAAVNLCSTLSTSKGVNVGVVVRQSARGIALPDDFVCLDMVTMGDNKPTTIIYGNDTATGRAQWNDYNRAKIDNPTVVYHSASSIDILPTGEEYAMYYEKKCSPTDPAITTSSVRYRHGVCLMAASMVYEAFHQFTPSERMRKLALTLIA